MFNLDINTKYINLEDYPEKMFKSQNKINFLLNYTKYKIDNTFGLKQLLNDIINNIEELKKNIKILYLDSKSFSNYNSFIKILYQNDIYK
jgi:hypothetical protein